jgi:hypothetical protein
MNNLFGPESTKGCFSKGCWLEQPAAIEVEAK